MEKWFLVMQFPFSSLFESQTIACPKRSIIPFSWWVGSLSLSGMGLWDFHSESIIHSFLRLTSLLVVNDDLGCSGIVWQFTEFGFL